MQPPPLANRLGNPPSSMPGRPLPGRPKLDLANPVPALGEFHGSKFNANRDGLSHTGDSSSRSRGAGMAVAQIRRPLCSVQPAGPAGRSLRPAPPASSCSGPRAVTAGRRWAHKICPRARAVGTSRHGTVRCYGCARVHRPWPFELPCSVCSPRPKTWRFDIGQYCSYTEYTAATHTAATPQRHVATPQTARLDKTTVVGLKTEGLGRPMCARACARIPSAAGGFHLG